MPGNATVSAETADAFQDVPDVRRCFNAWAGAHRSVAKTLKEKEEELVTLQEKTEEEQYETAAMNRRLSDQIGNLERALAAAKSALDVANSEHKAEVAHLTTTAHNANNRAAEFITQYRVELSLNKKLMAELRNEKDRANNLEKEYSTASAEAVKLHKENFNLRTELVTRVQEKAIAEKQLETSKRRCGHLEDRLVAVDRVLRRAAEYASGEHVEASPAPSRAGSPAAAGGSAGAPPKRQRSDRESTIAYDSADPICTQIVVKDGDRGQDGGFLRCTNCSTLQAAGTGCWLARHNSPRHVWCRGCHIRKKSSQRWVDLPTCCGQWMLLADHSDDRDACPRKCKKCNCNGRLERVWNCAKCKQSMCFHCHWAVKGQNYIDWPIENAEVLRDAAWDNARAPLPRP